MTSGAIGQESLITKRDSTFKSNAVNYVNHILGFDFAAKNIKFISMQYFGELSIAVFETKTTKNKEGRNTLLVYFKFNKYVVDTLRSVLDSAQIMKSIKGKKDCTLYIGQDKAKEIAKEAGLKDGIKPWRVFFRITKQTKIPNWTFRSIYTESSTDDHKAHGEEVNVSLIDGTFDKGNYDEWIPLQQIPKEY
jgi:hypothetical protein